MWEELLNDTTLQLHYFSYLCYKFQDVLSVQENIGLESHNLHIEFMSFEISSCKTGLNTCTVQKASKSVIWIRRYILYMHIHACICVYIGCNKNIEPVNYLEKYTLDRKVKKYVFSIFQKVICRCKNWRVSVPTREVDGGRQL